MLPGKSGHPQVEFGSSDGPTETRPDDRALAAIAALARASSLGGERFFADCVAQLAESYAADYAYIALVSVHLVLTMLAVFWSNSTYQKLFAIFWPLWTVGYLSFTTLAEIAI